MLSREAVRKLNDLVDVATDEPDGHINIDEIKNCWQLKGFFDDLVRVVSAGRYPLSHTLCCYIQQAHRCFYLSDITVCFVW